MSFYPNSRYLHDTILALQLSIGHDRKLRLRVKNNYYRPVVHMQCVSVLQCFLYVSVYVSSIWFSL